MTVKVTFLLLFSLLLCPVWSQTYTIGYKMYSKNIHGDLDEMSKEFLTNPIDKNSEPDLQLVYCNGVSLCGPISESKEVDDNKNSNENKISTIRVMHSVFYQNQEENLYMQDYGDFFIPFGETENPVISGELERYDWKITEKEMIISGYHCTLATTVDSNGEKIVAWYTDEIPIIHGVNGFFGLPGLILQLQVETRILYVMTSIQQENKQTSLEKPTGNMMSQEEFTQYTKELTKPRTTITPDGRERRVRIIPNN
ncbi:hypothetical protein GCM10022393_01140 [Aquimarina addita]|uniref:GLPGLI family protein n=1 Tax=Aquimarina addita TaxID=870485 RepID=A0ABP7X7H6_9FLAO